MKEMGAWSAALKFGAGKQRTQCQNDMTQKVSKISPSRFAFHGRAHGNKVKEFANAYLPERVASMTDESLVVRQRGRPWLMLREKEPRSANGHMQMSHFLNFVEAPVVSL
jgi:hypothetical protein